MEKEFKPLAAAQRIETLDVLRGVALLGILMMNIPFFATDYLSAENLIIQNELSGPNFYTWLIVSLLFEGTMRSIFSILFGAGVLLLLSRYEGKTEGLSGADIHYRRMIWLILFGAIHAYLFQWPGDILYIYGMAGLFLFPFRNLSAKKLLLISMLLALAISIVYSVGGLYRLQARNEMLSLQKERDFGTVSDTIKIAELEAWLIKQEKSSIDSLRVKSAQIQEKMQGNWLSSFMKTAPASFKFETSYGYTNLIWDAFIAIFLGMFLLKSGFLSGGFSFGFYARVMLGAYAIGLLLSWLHVRAMLLSEFHGDRYSEFMPLMLYQFRRLALALGHISLFLQLWKSGWFKWLMGALSAVGRMAFSNYIGQTVICTTLFYGFGFGLFGKLQRYEWYIVVGLIWVFQLAFSSLWLHYFQYGPLEWIWRRLTYWKQIPIKR